MIVGLTGKKGSGKDTVGTILVEEFEFVRVSYADALKQSAAALFGVPMEVWDELKNDGYACVVLHARDAAGFAMSVANLTVREFLQRYGTEAHRDVFGSDFWVDVAWRKMRNEVTDGSDVVVTDVRFDNEAEAVRDLGGAIVLVHREQAANSGDEHASEQLPTADYTLWNNGTLDELRNAVAFDVMGRGLPDKFTGGKR